MSDTYPYARPLYTPMGINYPHQCDRTGDTFQPLPFGGRDTKERTLYVIAAFDADWAPKRLCKIGITGNTVARMRSLKTRDRKSVV